MYCCIAVTINSRRNKYFTGVYNLYCMYIVSNFLAKSQNIFRFFLLDKDESSVVPFIRDVFIPPL